MKKSPKHSSPARRYWLKVRVSAEEKTQLSHLAQEAGAIGISDYVRQRCLNFRIRKSPLSRQLIGEIARIGSNLNQLAKWANSTKEAADAGDVIKALLLMDMDLKQLLHKVEADIA